jgi:biotin synthase
MTAAVTATLPKRMPTRHDWSRAEIQALLELPLLELLWRAQAVHREANPGYRRLLPPVDAPQQ